MKKIFNKSILVLLLGLVCCALQAAGAETFQGNGTETDPYLISSLSDLQALAKSVYDGTSYKGKVFKQNSNIVVNQNVINSDGTFNKGNENGFTNWKPAGRAYGFFTDNYFEGTYDGNGYSISGLFFSSDLDEVRVGLFGQAKNAILRNINIKDSYMGTVGNGTVNSDIHGFLVGLATECAIIDCHVTNSVMETKITQEACIGGLIGQASSPKALKDCSFSGTIIANISNKSCKIGGLAGYVTANSKEQLNIQGCTASGNVNAIIDFSKCEEDTYINMGGLMYTEHRGMNISSSDDAIIKMTKCVNRTNVNVASVNFADIDALTSHGNDIYENEIPSSNHLGKLEIYTMGGSVDFVNDCADFGSINLGHNNPNVSWYKGLAYVDNLQIAPFFRIEHEINSCALYGRFIDQSTNPIFVRPLYGGNGYDYWYYHIQAYNLAYAMGDDAIVNRVVRLNNKISWADDNLDYQDKDNIPQGVKLYSDSEQLKTDAQQIAKELSGYDADNMQIYSWGILSDEDDDFQGYPAPTTFGGMAGIGTEENPYLINSEQDLLFFKNYINTEENINTHYKLMSDIYMSNKASDASVEAIGTSEHPFLGTFDGNGHAIIGTKAKDGGLFGYVGGTIKNLAIINMSSSNTDHCYPLVNTLGVEGHTGTVTNCYVGGNITAKLNNTDNNYVAGLCGTINAGSTIENSYFKGTLNVDGPGTTRECIVAGLCNEVTGSLTNCYSIFEINSSTLHNIHSIAVTCNQSGSITDCYYMYKGEDGYLTKTYGTKAESYADIQMKSPFTTGIYNPVLKGTKVYMLNGMETGLDAITTADEATGEHENEILHYVPAKKEDYQNDQLIWQHPNLAVYNAADDAEYLLNGKLYERSTSEEGVIAKDLNLNMDKAKSQTIKANIKYTFLYMGHDQMVCLPVAMTRSDLPKGSKLKIIEKKSADNTVNIIECDEVPAGMPCLLTLPETYESSTDLKMSELQLRGTIAPEPVRSMEVDNKTVETELIGTYKKVKPKSNWITFIGPDGNLGSYTPSTGGTSTGGESGSIGGSISISSQDLCPFSAYAINDTQLTSQNNIVLEDGDVDVTYKIIEASNNSANGINVILKRSIKQNTWNTICLPFDVTTKEITEAFGEGTKVEKLEEITTNNDEFIIKFTKASEDANNVVMKAGYSYLIKPAQNGTEFIFKNKKINAQLYFTEDAHKQYAYKGTFAPVTVEGCEKEKGYNYFIQSNKIYYIPEGQAVGMRGFRCWIWMADGMFNNTPASSARLYHSDGSTTNLNIVEFGKAANGARIYNLQGMEMGKTTTKGIYIKNGKKYYAD